MSIEKYPIIYADPPWRYSAKKVQGAAENHYPTMSIEELCALPVAELAAKDSALFMWAINIVIFVIVYGRMIEIYLLTSLAPIPVATLSNRELGNTGQNYLKSLFAVGFQGLLILVCVAIYAVLIQGIATGGDPIGAIWGCMGYSVLLCFCLFKTGSIARSVFSAH